MATFREQAALERFHEILADAPANAAYMPDVLKDAAARAVMQADYLILALNTTAPAESPKLRGCRTCFGSGGKVGRPCRECNGTGKVRA